MENQKRKSSPYNRGKKAHHAVQGPPFGIVELDHNISFCRYFAALQKSLNIFQVIELPV